MFVVSVLVGYRHSGQGALVAERLEGGDGSLLPLLVLIVLIM